MKYRIILLIAGILVFNGITKSQETNEMAKPEEFFGFIPGTDNMLFNYEKLIDYLKTLDEKSDRVKLVEIGHSPEGHPIYITLISSAGNIKNIDKLKEINETLTFSNNLTNEELIELTEQGKVFVLSTLSMHSNEVGPSQSAPLIAWKLATTTNKQKNNWLDKVVYMMVPCHNPDGMDKVVKHYYRYKNTKYDGARMPGVYHKYVGHDNNRDFVTLTQEDTKAISSLTSRDWFPQVMIEKHQMGSIGVRYFVPPNHDPIAENVDAPLWNWIRIFGANMAKDMTADSLYGVAQNYLFDNYWPGSTETCLWKNVISMLTEAASVKYATPVYIEEGEISVYGKGLSEHKKSVNMPALWKGGWWRLSDIVDYEISSTFSMLKTAALHKNDILKFRYKICRSEEKKGRETAPYYYILPQKQHDLSELAALVNLLREHGIKVYTLKENTTISKRNFEKGDIVVPLAQAFRPFIKEVMEKQAFPERHYTPNGNLIKPYDITSWSLPLHKGLESVEINTKPQNIDSKIELLNKELKFNDNEDYNKPFYILNCNYNETYKKVFALLNKNIPLKRINDNIKIGEQTIPKGSFIVETNEKNKNLAIEILKQGKTVALPIETTNVASSTLSLPNIALVESWFHDMDAGWTRFIFDEYNIQYQIIRPPDFESAELSKFDVIVFPDERKDILKYGKFEIKDKQYNLSNYPPEYTKGMGEKGLQKLMNYIDRGGKVVSWAASAELFFGVQKIPLGKDKFEEFQLPIKTIHKELSAKGLYCPGSFVEVKLKENHQLTYGMQAKIGVFYRGAPVFVTNIPDFDMDRRIIGQFPEKKILMSGFCQNEELLSKRAAMVWVKKGKGQIVFFSFNPVFRASTPATYKLVFNSLFSNF